MNGFVKLTDHEGNPLYVNAERVEHIHQRCDHGHHWKYPECRSEISMFNGRYHHVRELPTQVVALIYAELHGLVNDPLLRDMEPEKEDDHEKS